MPGSDPGSCSPLVTITLSGIAEGCHRRVFEPSTVGGSLGIGTVLSAVAPESLTANFCATAAVANPVNHIPEAISLNNEGVRCLVELRSVYVSIENASKSKLEACDWQVAFDKFESALKLDPTYDKARVNLAIAHNNYGLYLWFHQKNSSKALHEFHQSVYLDAENATIAQQSIRGFIRGVLKKNPDRFVDRVALADSAREDKDFVGAVVEYRAALQLKDESMVRKKLRESCDLLNRGDKAIREVTQPN